MPDRESGEIVWVLLCMLASIMDSRWGQLSDSQWGRRPIPRKLAPPISPERKPGGGPYILALAGQVLGGAAQSHWAPVQVVCQSSVQGLLASGMLQQALGERDA